MPNRMLRDWTDSEKINSISAASERFFTRLIMKVDDYGCFNGDTRLLRANLFPLKIETIKDADISLWVEECERAGLIKSYQHGGKKYLQINDFGQRLDKARAKFPLPDGAEIKIGGYVYVIKSESDNISKIGFSLNPWARVKEVAQKSGKAVNLEMTFVGTTYEEKAIHKLLRSYNYEGEWFKLPKKIFQLFSDCYKDKASAVEVIVAIRNYSSRSETEVEVEPELIPKNSKSLEAPSRPPSYKKWTEDDFYAQVGKHKEQYPKEMLRSFFDYWREKSASEIMRFQLEKTWDTSLRLKTWKNRDKDFAPKNGIQIDFTGAPPLKTLR